MCLLSIWQCWFISTIDIYYHISISISFVFIFSSYVVFNLDKYFVFTFHIEAIIICCSRNSSMNIHLRINKVCKSYPLTVENSPRKNAPILPQA